MNIERGDILLIELDPTKGSEIRKTRPGIVVSNDVANTYSQLITIVPLTSQRIDQIFPSEVFIPQVKGLKVKSKAKVSQIRAIDRTRIKSKLGKVTSSTLQDLNLALKLHLGIF